MLGLLGPNGAGKSTLMRILATITKPTEGRVRWNGEDIATSPDGLRSVLGYLPQDFGVYPNLTAVEFLEYLAAVKGLESGVARRRIDELLALVNLTDARKRPLGGYSGGMKQRIGIAQALLNDPKLLIVDEPTVGLDPEERVRFRNLLSDLGGERIVILSTHIVSDVEAAANEIAIVDRGRLLTHAEPEALLAGVQLPATWAAGVLLAVATGSGAALHFLVKGDLAGVGAWLVGALFIPTFALALGVWSGTSKLFEILYLVIWYIGPMNHVPAMDYLGSTKAGLAQGMPLAYLALTALLAAAAVAGRRRQLRAG